MVRVGIVGGGISGLSTAYYLQKAGHEITLFEPGEFGGLISTVPVGHGKLEKYYHHFFRSDRALIELVEELGLSKHIFFHETQMGFYYKNRIYDFSTPLDLLKLPIIPFNQRIRMGFSILYLQRKKNWRELEKITAKDWFMKWTGKEAFETIWKPLLRTKFTDAWDKISMSWIWGRVHARAGSRERGVEKLGYLRGGGFDVLTDELVKKIGDSQGTFIREKVVEVHSGNVVHVKTLDREFEFDKVIFTTPTNVILKCLPELDASYSELVRGIKYQAVVCMILQMKKQLSDIYWLNMIDKSIPFSGVIEQTNFIPIEEYGCHVCYLFNYVPADHQLYTLTDKELFEVYFEGLQKVFPKLKRENIISSTVSRSPFATPIYLGEFSKTIPDHKTSLQNVYVANTSQIYPFDRNVSHGIELAKKMVAIIEENNEKDKGSEKKVNYVYLHT